MAKILNDSYKQARKVKSNKVENYMGGISYKVNPLETLKMVTASSIFGEPAYYESGEVSSRNYNVFGLFDTSISRGKLMEQSIDDALDYSFKETLDWAKELRTVYNMRLNPQIIMVRASIHKDRQAFNDKNPKYFRKINEIVMGRGDDAWNQLAYYNYINGGKNNLPNILKQSWKDFVENQSEYTLNKYKTSGHLIDLVRISHAKGDLIDSLMRNELKVSDDVKSMANLRSEGKSWTEILRTTKVPHVALLRSLTSIFSEITDRELGEQVLNNLVSGVVYGKQFPYRYYNAYKIVEETSNLFMKPVILDKLNECLEQSVKNMPKLKGKTAILSDNSGSAWGGVTTEYGSTLVAEIGNLSAVLTALSSDEGYVYVFGDKLIEIPVVKSLGVMGNLKVVNEKGKKVGMSTEQGLFDFFQDSLKETIIWDNIFIYSDMQAGTNDLYGNYRKDDKYLVSNRYFNFKLLVNDYREQINKKVNIFSVQTAGYRNNVLPDYGYRTNLMYGWTGKETVFAKTMIDLWDEVENNQ